MWTYPSGVQSTPDLAWDGMFLIQRHIYRIPIVHAEICEQSKLGAHHTSTSRLHRSADSRLVGCRLFALWVLNTGDSAMLFPFHVG
jgi:hypothetical protein